MCIVQIFTSGSKWHSRRKLLTPTFHFKILENFIKVFNEHCIVLAKQLESAVKTEKCFDIYPFITYCTLDIICGIQPRKSHKTGMNCVFDY